MRRPDGRMSKKDRRAIQAFGLRPSEPEGSEVMRDLLARVIANNGVQYTWSNTWNGPPMTVGQNWYLAMDPSAQQGGHAMVITGSVTISTD